MLKLNESIEFLHKTSMKKRKESESFLQALREWALEEDLYSKSLERITNHDGLKSSIFKDLRKCIQEISQKSKHFSENVTNNIISHFKELLTTQSHSIKTQFNEGKKLGEYIIKKYNKVSDAMLKYFSSCQECEQIAFDLDKETSNSKKDKIFQKMQTLKKEVDVNFEGYKKAVSGFNQSAAKFMASVEKLVEAYNFHEEKRCKCFEESLSSLASFVTSLSYSFFQIEFSPGKIRKQNFTSEYFSIEEMFIEDYEGSHPLFKGATRSKFHFSVLETSGVSLGTQVAVEELYKSEVGEIITKAWMGEDLTSEDYMKFNQIIKEPLGRKAWAWSMNLRRANGNFKISEKGFTTIGELMLAALNECERTNDIYIAKNCIILSQTFHKDIQGSKFYLQSYILDHSIWKNIEIWESIVNNAIFEGLKKQQGNNGFICEEESLVHEKSLVFCQLVSFIHIMLSFKVTVKVARDFIGKYADKYDFSKNESEDIMQAVNDSLEMGF